MRKFCLNIIATLLILIAVVMLAVFGFGSSRVEKVAGLPKVEITLNGVELDEVIHNSKEIKYEENVVKITNGEVRDEYVGVELKGRGNSTWGLDKSPFQIKFSQKVDLFGMGKAKKWVLLANYFDKSNLRNDIAFYLERMLGERFALEGRFAELYINGECQGIYYLAEKVEVGKERVNLHDPYGVVVEVENLHAAQEECYWTSSKTCLALQDAVVEENTDEAMTRFRDVFEELEMAAKKGDYEKVKELADTESLAIYYLLSEFTVNPDAYASSYYFYKDGEGDVIHAGPGWDFDLALGNRVWNWGYGEQFYLPETEGALKIHALGGNVYDAETGELIKEVKEGTMSNLIYYLLEIPDFKNEVDGIYQERMMGRREELLNYVKKQAIRNLQVAVKDRKIWRESEDDILEMVGIDDNEIARKIFHGNSMALEAYLMDVVNLLDWLGRRFDLMDRVYGNNLNLNKIT